MQQLQRFFPRPRKPFRLVSLWPLIVFSLIYLGVCLYLEFSSTLVFTRLWPFWLMLLLPWFWWMAEAGFSGLGRGRAVTAMFVRFIVVGLFVMLLAEPRAVRKNETLSIVYALDLSDSIGEEAVDGALEYVVRTAQQRPERDQVGLIVFGREAAVELPPRQVFPFETVNSRINRDGTDIKKGLSLAAALLPDDRNGRIVLISDGTTTSGNLRTILDELKARDVAVDVLPIEYDFDHEVWLEKLELPRSVKLGETYEAAVVLNSLKAGQGELVLQENGVDIHRQPVKFTAGKNRFTMPIYLRDAGYYEYTARIDVPKERDGWVKNNVAINYLYLKGKGKVLLVRDEDGDERDWQVLAKAIKESGRDLEIVDSLDMPRDSLSMMPYDCILFVNVPADAFDAVQLQAVRDAVYNQGSGFMMVGGSNSFGPGGYHRSAIEEVLPVDMDISNKKVLPKGALAIVLHTCEFSNGNTWAKRIAKSAIKVMGAQDEVGLLAWDGQDKWIFPLTPASQYDKLAQKINNCDPMDMPSFVGTMQLGLNALSASDAAAKHMIIISDGDPQPPHPSMIQKFRDNQISVSTVLVDGFHQGGFQAVMRSIAVSTGGRFYYPKNPKQLPSIFIKEAKTLKKSMIQNKTFVPEVEFFDEAVLKGINSLPKLRGYVLTSAKGDPRRCSVLLRGPDEDQLDPVLAIGRFGIGKSAAFTSDLSPNWGQDWVQWDKYQAFIKQLIINISRVSKEGSLRMQTYTAGNQGVIVVEDFHPEAGMLEMMVKVDGPRGQQINLKMEQSAPRRYRAEFPLWGKGRYQVMAVAAGEGRQERLVSGFVVPYSAEYLRFRSTPRNISRIAEETGGRLLNGREEGKELFSEGRKVRKASQPIFDWFLIILAILLPLDVAVRRIQLDWYSVKLFLGFGRQSTESTKTMGSLLERKKSIDFGESGEEKQSPVPPRPKSTIPSIPKPPSRPAAPPPKPAPAQKKEESSEGEGKGDSTTGRLLAMKRKKRK